LILGIYSIETCFYIYLLYIFISTLTQRILAQLKEELNGKTEKYYQIFTIDLSDKSNINDGSYSAE